MSVLNMNQFSQGPVVGQLDLQTNPNPAVLTARYDPEETNNLNFGVGLILTDLGATDSDGPPIVTLRAADTDAIFAVRIFSTKQGEVEPGEPVEIAMAGAVIWMEAAAALDRGVQVSLDVAADGQVQAVGSNAVFGITLDKAGAEGDLIRVLVTADGVTEGTT